MANALFLLLLKLVEHAAIDTTESFERLDGVDCILIQLITCTILLATFIDDGWANLLLLNRNGYRNVCD